MRIYLDDCADDDDLIAALERAGHEVLTPRTEGLRGADDPVHLQHAVLAGCVILTLNPSDFEQLHDEYQSTGHSHNGILLVYQDRHRSKNMRVAQVVAALGNLIASGIPIEHAVHNLNHWR